MTVAKGMFAGLLATMAVGVASAAEFTWTGKVGDGKWTNPANWSVGTGYPESTNDVVRFTGDARVTLDTGRTTAISHLVVSRGEVLISSTPGSALRTAAAPGAVGRDGFVVGPAGDLTDKVKLVLDVPVDCAGSRMDKWWGGSLVIRNGLVSSMSDPEGFGFIFGSGLNALESGAKVLIPNACLGFGNGAPNHPGTSTRLRIDGSAKVAVSGLRMSVRSIAHESVVIEQVGAASEVRVDGCLCIGYHGTKAQGNTYRLADGLLEVGAVALGDPASDRLVLAGGTFIATQDMTLPPETVFEGSPRIGADEDCRLTLVKWPDGAKGLTVAGKGEVVLARGFEKKGPVKVLGGKVVDRTSDVIDVGSGLEVFWDDHIVDTKRTTAVRQVHQPEYVGVVMTHDAPWEGDGCDFHNIVIDEDARGTLYRMYYLGWQMSAMTPPEENAPPYTGIRVCYAESRDGLSWTKPELGLVDYNGSKQNNILFDVNHFGYSWDNFMVFKDGNPKCPADERYKGIGVCWGKADADGFGDGLCCFLSADGIHWRKGWRLTKAGDFDSLNVAFWDPVRREYHCYFRCHHDQNPPDRHGNVMTRDIRHMVSKDFRRWSTPKPLVYDEGAEDVALYTNVVQPYPRAPGIYVGFPSRYVERKKWTDTFDKLPGVVHRRTRSKHSPRYGLTVTDCVFMMSRDGFNFHREEDAFMEPGPENPLNWVYGDCYPARGILTLPGRRPGSDPELTFYNFEGHWSGKPESILRYVLRQDGFVSRRAPYAGAKLVTKPFIFDGDELALNFKTSARGDLFVTLREANGARAIHSGEIIGNKIDRIVGFEDGKAAEFSGKTVVLEFAMRDADVYAFQFRKRQ